MRALKHTNLKVANVAPTLLELLGLPAPHRMSGKSMLAVLKN